MMMSGNEDMKNPESNSGFFNILQGKYINRSIKKNHLTAVKN